MRRWTLSLLLGLGALGLLGCPGPYSAEGYCTKSAEVYCKFMYSCCTPSERINQFGLLILMGGAHTNIDECKEKATKLTCATLSPYAESVKVGRGTWDEAKAQSCMQKMEEAASSCNAQSYFEGTGDDCDLNGDIFKGAVADGASCYFDAECQAAGSSCVTRTSSDPSKELRTVEGTCKGAPGAGQPCDSGDCAEGLYCDGDDLCQTPKALAAPCDISAECQSGYCAYDSTANDSICTAKLALTETCYNSSECDSGNCDDTLNECAAKRSNGNDCNYDSECQSGNCDSSSDTCLPAEGSSEVETTYDLCDGNDVDPPLMSMAVSNQAVCS